MTRTARALASDLLVVVVAAATVLVGDLGWLDHAASGLPADVVWAMAACVLLLGRRRWPLPTAVLFALGAVLFPLVAGPALVALFSLAVHRSLRYTLPIGGVLLVADLVRSQLDLGVLSVNAIGHTAATGILIALVIVWGGSVRQRRQLVASLIELARNAESTERDRIMAVRAAERSLLAREMHDVLAHRMSLVSLHAGAIEFRADASGEEVRQAAGVIRAGVHQMLVDLRDVIGMLRDDTRTEPTSLSPSMSSVAGLFEESERAGTPVTATIEVEGDLDALPGSVDRAAYRVVQEGLTNARKHGGGATVAVRISGSPKAGLTVQVRQPLGPGTAIPGSGSGLAGLGERVHLVGGSLEFGPDGADFLLTAHLAWRKAA